MAPKPKPLHQGEHLFGNDVIRIEACDDRRDADERGTASTLREDRTQQRLGGACGFQPLPEQEQEVVVIRAPRRSLDSRNVAIRTSPLDLKKTKDSTGRILLKRSPPSSKRQDPVGIMMRNDDLLDRTFDNVEHFVCKAKTTRSSKAGLPPPIFSCTDSMSDDRFELSNAKLLGNAIEVNHGGETDTTGVMADLGRVSILDERSGVDDSNGSTQLNKRRASGQMLGFLFESVNGILGRETQVAATQSPTTSDVTVDTKEKSSPTTLHPIVGGDKEISVLNSCGYVFNPVDPTIRGEPKTTSVISGGRPSQYTSVDASVTTKASHTVPADGMMLLPDGSIVSPSQYKTEQQRQLQLKKQQRGQIYLNEHISLRMSRENSLLDLEAGLGPEEETDQSSAEVDNRLERLRQKKRVLEERLSRKTVATTDSIFIPRDHTRKASSVKEKAGNSPVSVEQIERSQFRKRVVLAVTICLVACALVIFAMSFFWPLSRSR